MSFGDAVRSVFSQYARFTGRARRSEYWYFALFTLLVDIAIRLLAALLNAPLLSLLAVLVGLAFLVPSLAVAVRRLHDTGRSGWWLLIGLIPLAGAIVLIVFMCMDSEPGPNSYGPSPKDAVADHQWSQESPTAPPTWH